MQITFTQEELNYTLNALAARPFGEVAQLIFKIQQQLSEQQQPAAATAEPAQAS